MECRVRAEVRTRTRVNRGSLVAVAVAVVCQGQVSAEKGIHRGIVSLGDRVVRGSWKHWAKFLHSFQEAVLSPDRTGHRKPGQTGSNQVKPGQTRSNQVKPGQTRSNQVKPGQTTHNLLEGNSKSQQPTVLTLTDFTTCTSIVAQHHA